MIPRRRAAAALTALALLILPAAPALAAFSCGTQTAAGLAEPKQKAAASPGRFRIYWHVGTQIEQIADAPANPGAMADLKRAKGSADGYYVMGAMSGSLGYWPGRPVRCLANFKRVAEGDKLNLGGESHQFEGGGGALKQQCAAQLGKALSPKGQALTQPGIDKLQIDAFQKAAGILDLAGESRRGKIVMAPVLIREDDFAYDAKADQLTMTALPSSYCSLARAGIAPDTLLVYQEVRGKNMLRIPLSRQRQPTNADFLPRNARVFGLVDKAFDKAHVPLAGISPNLRVWNPSFRRLLGEFRDNPTIEGINFEASTKLLADNPNRIGSIAQGIAYILANTSYDVTLLIPGYWQAGDTGSTAGIDGLTARNRSFVQALDAQLRKYAGNTGGKSPLCTSRIALIPASYGNPVHPATLPAKRSGGWAGTVTGQIGLLSDMRTELCGK